MIRLESATTDLLTDMRGNFTNKVGNLLGKYGHVLVDFLTISENEEMSCLELLLTQILSLFPTYRSPRYPKDGKSNRIICLNCESVGISSQPGCLGHDIVVEVIGAEMTTLRSDVCICNGALRLSFVLHKLLQLT